MYYLQAEQREAMMLAFVIIVLIVYFIHFPLNLFAACDCLVWHVISHM